MTLEYDGKVGIGTTSPNVKLEVNGIVRITNSSGLPDFQLFENSSDYFRIRYDKTNDYTVYTSYDGGSHDNHYFHDNIYYDGSIGSFMAMDDLKALKNIKEVPHPKGDYIDKESLPYGLLAKHKKEKGQIKKLAKEEENCVSLGDSIGYILCKECMKK